MYASVRFFLRREQVLHSNFKQSTLILDRNRAIIFLGIILVTFGILCYKSIFTDNQEWKKKLIDLLTNIRLMQIFSVLLFANY